jgi:hypothetical protein
LERTRPETCRHALQWHFGVDAFDIHSLMKQNGPRRPNGPTTAARAFAETLGRELTF